MAFGRPTCWTRLLPKIWREGRYEPQLFEFLQSIANGESTFIDVGASIGAFTIPLSSAFAQVIAIEAAPKIAAILRANVARNELKNVAVVECAASDGSSEQIDFFEAPMSQFGMGSGAPQFDAQPIKVPAKALDDLVGINPGLNVAAIKVDVEGFEAAVFHGARRLLGQPHSPPVVFEFADWAEERAFEGRAGWAQEILQHYGYSVWRLNDYLARRPPLSEPLRRGFETIVAVKR
jgi:FkbM family methyltransferase